VAAVIRPESVLTLFMRMRTQGIGEALKKMYADRKVNALLWETVVAGANGRVRFLPGSS